MFTLLMTFPGQKLQLPFCLYTNKCIVGPFGWMVMISLWSDKFPLTHTQTHYQTASLAVKQTYCQNGHLLLIDFLYTFPLAAPLSPGRPFQL